jgi:hypothetical protein
MDTSRPEALLILFQLHLEHAFHFGTLQEDTINNWKLSARGHPSPSVDSLVRIRWRTKSSVFAHSCPLAYSRLAVSKLKHCWNFPGILASEKIVSVLLKIRRGAGAVGREISSPCIPIGVSRWHSSCNAEESWLLKIKAAVRKEQKV